MNGCVQTKNTDDPRALPVCLTSTANDTILLKLKVVIGHKLTCASRQPRRGDGIKTFSNFCDTLPKYCCRGPD